MYAAPEGTWQNLDDDPWYVDAVGDLWDWATGLFGSPGAECAKVKTSWVARYACTWQAHGGEPCPGAPDPRRAALAAKNDPAGAESIRRRLDTPINDHLAPTVQEMRDPVRAVLWVHAAMGGWDCIARTDPGLPDALDQWVRSATPGWTPPSSQPPPTYPGPGGGEPEPNWAALIFQEAAARGEAAGAELLEEAAASIVGAIPQSWRDALRNGVAEYYAGQAGGAVRANAGKVALVAVGGWILYELAAAGREG